MLDAIEHERGGVCVLASGDPGFFGIVRVLAERFGPERLDVHPAPSSVSLAFARLGLPWDDAAVISAHGRPLADAARRAVRHQKAAVLVAPDAPPEALGRELRALGAPHRRAAVCSRLGEPDERVDVLTLEQLAAGSFDPMSVVVLLDGDEVAADADPRMGPVRAALRSPGRARDEGRGPRGRARQARDSYGRRDLGCRRRQRQRRDRGRRARVGMRA